MLPVTQAIAQAPGAGGSSTGSGGIGGMSGGPGGCSGGAEGVGGVSGDGSGNSIGPSGGCFVGGSAGASGGTMMGFSGGSSTGLGLSGSPEQMPAILRHSTGLPHLPARQDPSVGRCDQRRDATTALGRESSTIVDLAWPIGSVAKPACVIRPKPSIDSIRTEGALVIANIPGPFQKALCRATGNCDVQMEPIGLPTVDEELQSARFRQFRQFSLQGGHDPMMSSVSKAVAQELYR